MSNIVWHIEECIDNYCEGQCHEIHLECQECGFEETYEDDDDDIPEECPECDCEFPESLNEPSYREDFHADG